jgi:hypothetical protein
MRAMMCDGEVDPYEAACVASLQSSATPALDLGGDGRSWASRLAPAGADPRLAARVTVLPHLGGREGAEM